MTMPTTREPAESPISRTGQRIAGADAPNPGMMESSPKYQLLTEFIRGRIVQMSFETGCMAEDPRPSPGETFRPLNGTGLRSG
jgi:hypothetical protein